MKGLVIGFLFVVLSPMLGIAQVISITNFFRASETQGKVLLSWQIETGNTCNGIQIFRGTDSTALTQIGEIIGVCGSITEPIDYSFLDDKISKNGIYYYRLEFGTQGYSEIVTTVVDGVFSNASQTRPNPVSTKGKIFFKKPDNQSYNLALYNAFGQKVFEKTTQESFFTINAIGLENGAYIYAITSEKGVLIAKERLLINH